MNIEYIMICDPGGIGDPVDDDAVWEPTDDIHGLHGQIHAIFDRQLFGVPQEVRMVDGDGDLWIYRPAEPTPSATVELTADEIDSLLGRWQVSPTLADKLHNAAASLS